MSNDKPHLFLNNPRGEKNYFNAARSFKPVPILPKDPSAYRTQKNKLSGSLSNFRNKQNDRIEQRTLVIPAHLEYIRVDFLSIFNNNDQKFKTKSHFKNWGLSPVLYTNFNQSVLFAIVHPEKFKGFIAILEAFIRSNDVTAPQGKPYAIATLIFDFEFLSTERILTPFTNDILLSLVNKSSEINEEFDLIYNHLSTYLTSLQESETIKSFHTDEHSTIEINDIPVEVVRSLAANYDIIYKVQSLRVPTIRPNEFNQPGLTWNMDIQPPVNDVIIGVLDNGVKPIRPLEKIVLPSTLDITNSDNPDATIATRPHGTVVASLAAVGKDLFDTSVTEFIADAYILPIKILNFDEGCFNIYEIEHVIIEAIENGVKIFNLSVCGQSKLYNSPVSEYAYLLDRLAYNYDILIFIATGNLGEEDARAMQEEDGENPLHQYPNHFYNPNSSSDYHNCESINVCIPSESFNNMTVGAIAENYRQETNSDLTPFKELPAFYTRKHYIDRLKKINSTEFQDSQKNRNINKPDIVMPGGDRLNNLAGMQVLGFGLNGNDFYNLDSGTSLATPLAANLAAKILGKYPDLRMQSVKALILNSSERLLNSDFLKELEVKIKGEESQKQFAKSLTDLNVKEKKFINSKFSSESLYKNLVGCGTPIIEKALYSGDKNVTLMIQDSIRTKTHKVININIPEYLLEYSKSKILHLKATLCYKFYPVWGNQLAYNPLHISFNFFRSLIKNDPVKNSEIISNRDDPYYNQFYIPGMTDEKKAKERKLALGIKTELKSWSEDFFPVSNKPFSNVQQLSLNIDKNEISKVGNQISLVIRCTNKPILENDFTGVLLNGLHEFSIALTISEKPNAELVDFSLYDELIACNDLEAVGTLSTEGDLEADLNS